MVTEIADFRVLPDRADGFAAAAERGLAFIAASPGFLGARLTRSVETPTRFVLLVEWETVEAHTVTFRGSENFAKWRAEVGPFFDGAPTVEHGETVVTYPG